jgi:hypothetical protein
MLFSLFVVVEFKFNESVLNETANVDDCSVVTLSVVVSFILVLELVISIAVASVDDKEEFNGFFDVVDVSVVVVFVVVVVN